VTMYYEESKYVSMMSEKSKKEGNMFN